MRAHSVREAGFTFAELAFGLLIMVLGAALLINHLAVNYQTTATERDRVFAYSKAQGMLAEIQAFVDRGSVDAAVDLDVLDDGIVNKTPLTIQTEGGSLVAADHVISGNYQRDGQWVWARRITVQPFVGLNNRNVRYVTVRIYKRDQNGVEHPMADLSSVINSAGSAFPTTQVFDVYLLAVESIPGWWVFMESIVPFVESMITDLETRNPGLTFRTHWITKASFGRNHGYRPFTNAANDSYTPSPDVYVYPGKMPAGNASAYYYVPDNFRARMNVDGTEQNGHGALNPLPYALSDYFNHAMRYPDEVALWQARVALVEAKEAEIEAARLAGLPLPAELTDMSKEPTLRLFLEDLYTNPAKYRNAMIINLHGELLPVPALRNYSDAAKDPENHPADPIRVVTHPEELRTKRADGGVTDPLRLRMYAYRTDARGYAGSVDRMDQNDPMVVDVMNMDLTDTANARPTRIRPTCTLENVPGGVPVAGSSDYATAWQAAIHVDDGPVAGQMHYKCEFVVPGGGSDPFTRIYLYNTPLIAPPVTQSSQTYGLSASEQANLYWMPYIPSPVTVAGGVPTFAQDLTTAGANTPKNTARWRLDVPATSFADGSFVDNLGAGIVQNDDVVVKVRTRIGTGEGLGETDWQDSGTTWPAPMQPDNLSVTYAWWANSRDDVPATERAQFNGDPRHLPYKDCFTGGDDFPQSYNWYHDSLVNTNNATTQFTSLTAANLANLSHTEIKSDVPRVLELFRTGLTKSACVYTSLTGFSYYYVGVGNDIGYDAANGYPSSIPINLTPFGSASNGFIDTIIGNRRFVRLSGANYWWGMPWLGELYPDALASQWFTGSRGNLTAGTGANQFYQATCRAVYSGSNRTAWGTYMHDNRQRTGLRGCTTFFNIGTSTSTFCHVASSGNGTLSSIGQEIADNYSMTMPAAAPISRPFLLNYNGSADVHFNQVPYSTNRYTGSLFRTYYTHGAGTGSGLMKLVDTAGTNASYIIINGIDRTVESGTTFIAKFAVLSLVHSFFEAGSSTNTMPTRMLPRIEIESPTDITELNDPTNIVVQYGAEWTRWDGRPYTATGTFSGNEAELEYVLMYSNDNGTTWLYMQDDQLATPGYLPANTAYRVADAGAGPETFTWSVPSASFPEGSYLVRIDCFRQAAQVHYSYHQTKIFIQR